MKFLIWVMGEMSSLTGMSLPKDSYDVEFDSIGVGFYYNL